MGEIKLDVKPSWPCFNPSVAADGDAFRMIVRTANYQIERGVLHSDGILQNVNYLLALDRDLGVTSIEPIVDRTRRPAALPLPGAGVRGLPADQVRRSLVRDGDGERAEPDGAARGRAARASTGADIVAVQPLQGPRRGRHEKNWMPFVADNSLAVVYSCGPTVVLRCDTESGAMVP